MNTFRLLGDLSHLLAIIILLHKLWKTKSCSGISGKSQILFAIVFTTRYLDLATTFISAYNTSMKIFFLTASYGTIYLIYIRLKKTYNDAHDSFGIEFLVLPAIALAVLINHAFDVLEVLWTFSIYLESVAILPQLYLICKTGESEVTFYYLLTLFAYRALYEINWIYRYNVEHFYDEIAIVAGIVQTSLYILYFFYFYVIRANRRKDSVFHITVTEELKTSDLVNKLNPHGHFSEKQPKEKLTERIDVRTAELSKLQEELMDGLDRDACQGSCDKTDLEINVVENMGKDEQTTGPTKLQEQVIVRMERED